MKLSLAEEYKSLLRLGGPVLVTQIGIILVTFVDTAMVGAYGVPELAASAFVNSIFLIPGVMLIGFAQGTTPLVGALFGRNDSSGIGRILRSGLQLNFWISLAFTLLMGGTFFLLHLFGQDADLLPVIRPYYLTILPGMIPMAIFNCLQQTSNGLTDTKTPMWIILGANALNVLGNYMLIFGKFGMPELGLFGAGLSTLISRLCAALAMILFFLRSRRFRPYWLECRRASGLHAERRKMWQTSYPVMIQSGLEVALWSFGAIVCGWFGKVQLAAYQVVNTIAQLGFMIFLSFGVATSIRVANFTGQKDFNMVRRTTLAGIHINLLLATLACIVFYAAGKHLIGIFTPDREVTEVAMTLIVPLILYQYGDATQLTYANALRGTSNVRPLMYVAAIVYLVVGIPAAYLLGVTAGLHDVGVYYSFSLALFLAAWLLRRAFLRTLRSLSAG